MNKDKEHIRIRTEVENLMTSGHSIEDIATRLNLPLGTRYLKGSAKWYRYCIKAKINQKKAIEKDPLLYSKAGKIAQQKHPELGINLGKKYGPIYGALNRERLKGNSAYYSMMAKKLQEKDPEHSRRNMRKTHQIMRDNGTFNEHQRLASINCRKMHPNQLKEMSKKAHSLYPLALMGLESRRRNYPFKFMECTFDSDSERRVCEIFVQHNLMDMPEDGKNIHFRINKAHIDFFIQNKVFVEFHPPVQYGIKKGETVESYYNYKRKILDDNGYKDYPLIVIDRLRAIEPKIRKIKKLLAFELDKRVY